MCLTKQSKSVQLRKDQEFWKVFGKRPSGILEPIHNTGCVCSPFFPPNKSFLHRNGYQVFETRKQALAYQRALNKANYTGFTTRKVLVKKGEYKIKGMIGYGFVGAGKPALRVSSLRIKYWRKTNK